MYGVRVVVAYDGTDFAGWQRQPGQRTVQETLEDVARAMAGPNVRMRAAGRTDAGVHALGQVVGFDSVREIAPTGWVKGLNALLPADISIRAAAPCDVGYDPRFDATEKTYRYVLHVGETRDPALRRTSWHLVRGLDVGRMREAAGFLVGRHDFRAFKSADDKRENTFRTVHEIRITEGFSGHRDLVAIDVRGDAFMKNMVRIITGTLVDVARGRLAAAELAALLTDRSKREEAGRTAPAHGLTLVEVLTGRKALQKAHDDAKGAAGGGGLAST